MALIASTKATRDTAYAAMNMQWTWVATQDAAFKFVSGQDGLFEVVGLEAGMYKLIEVKAPAGYAKLPDKEFEVGPGTYNTAEPMEIVNVKVTIPETGGIGTIVFAVVGILLMGGAVMAYRRREEEA